MAETCEARALAASWNVHRAANWNVYPVVCLGASLAETQTSCCAILPSAVERRCVRAGLKIERGGGQGAVPWHARWRRGR
jgi:hypothetical protein